MFAEEVIEAGNSPSVASGVSQATYEEEIRVHENTRITWMLEPLRASAVYKWCGTTSWPNGQGKDVQTLMAFVHFAYLWTKESTVFADLQCMYYFLLALYPKLTWH